MSCGTKPRTEQYRVGSYNVRKGRRPHRVMREVRRLMRTEHLHALTLLEVGTQVDYLAKHLPDHLRVFYIDGTVSARDSAVVVDMRHAERMGWWVGGLKVHRLSERGWERAPRNRWKGLHHYRSGVSVRVGPLRVMAPHMPPGPHSWPLRGEAFRDALEAFAGMAHWWNRHDVPWLAIGDWNNWRHEKPMRDLLEEVDATAKGGRIDYPVAGPDVTILSLRRVHDEFYRSDHKPIVAALEVNVA